MKSFNIENLYLLLTKIIGFQMEAGFKTTNSLFMSGLCHSRLLSIHSYKCAFHYKCPLACFLVCLLELTFCNFMSQERYFVHFDFVVYLT